jgi:hypothetical protein
MCGSPVCGGNDPAASAVNVGAVISTLLVMLVFYIRKRHRQKLKYHL